MLVVLADEPRTVGELAKEVPVSRPAVSRHLRLLQDAGLVDTRPEGRSIVISLRKKGFEQARAWLDAFWDDALNRFALVAENLDE
jgi:DNA-binding transcriptional ArsR family regulator